MKDTFHNSVYIVLKWEIWRYGLLFIGIVGSDINVILSYLHALIMSTEILSNF